MRERASEASVNMIKYDYTARRRRRSIHELCAACRAYKKQVMPKIDLQRL